MVKKRRFLLDLGLPTAFLLSLISALAVSAGSLPAQPSQGASMTNPRLSASPAQANAYWTQPRDISQTTEDIATPRIVVDSNGDLHMLYLVVVNSGPGTGNLFYRKSTDLGATWSTADSVTSDGNSRQPDLAVAPNGTMHIVWMEDAGSDNFDVKYTSGTAGNWATAETVSAGGGLQAHPAIAVEENYAHIVWGKPNPSNPDIAYRHKDLTNGQWMQDPDIKFIVGSAASDFNPDIAVDSDGKLYIAWTEGLATIYYSHSTDQGASWSLPVILSGALANCRVPALTLGSDDYVHVTWGRWLSNDEQYLYYANFQHPPSSLALINPTGIQFGVDNEPYDLRPDIAVVGSDEVHIVLNGEKEAGEEEEIYYLISETKGTDGSWSSLVRISRAPLYSSIAPAIAADGDVVYVAWKGQDAGGHYDLLFSVGFPYRGYLSLLLKEY